MQIARHLARKSALVLVAASPLLIGIGAMGTNVATAPAATIAAPASAPGMFLDAQRAAPRMFLD
jgi:hypothetical protein